MPKRKHTDKDYQHLLSKLKKLESEIKNNRKKRVRVLSSSSTSSQDSTCQSEPKDCELLRPDVDQDDIPNDLESAPASDTVPVSSSEPPNTSIELVLADETTSELNSEILEILGIDPTKTNKFGKEIQNDLALRLEHLATSGLTKDVRKELTDRYLIPSNCKLVDAPGLNPEIKAAVSEIVTKRDKAIQSNQKLIASSISGLGEALTVLLTAKEKNTDLIRLIMDSARMLCDCQHNNSLTRRNYVLYSLKKDLKEQLQNSKIDSLLFGENLPDTLKAAKAINKSGAELKIYTAPKTTPAHKSTPSSSKNWKGPARRQPANTKTKETPASAKMSTRTRRGNSSKQSQSQRVTHSRR